MKQAKRAEVLARVSHLPVVDLSTWIELKEQLGPISDNYLRSLLRESGKPLSPLVEGVRTSTLPEAARTLLALASEYEQGDLPLRGRCRTLVLQAKQRLKSRLHRSASAEAKEVFLWVSIWLENPLLFAVWHSIRERQSKDSPGCPDERSED